MLEDGAADGTVSPAVLGPGCSAGTWLWVAAGASVPSVPAARLLGSRVAVFDRGSPASVQPWSALHISVPSCWVRQGSCWIHRHLCPPCSDTVPHPWLVAVSHPCWQCPIHSESAPSMLRMSHPRWQCPIHGGSAPWLCEGQLCSSCDFSAFPRAGASTGAVLCCAEHLWAVLCEPGLL